MLTLSTSTTITRVFIPCGIQSQTHFVNKNKGEELKPQTFCSKYVNKAAKQAHVWIYYSKIKQIKQLDINMPVAIIIITDNNNMLSSSHLRLGLLQFTIWPLSL